MPRVIIVPGWKGSATSFWFPWLKAQLIAKYPHITVDILDTPPIVIDEYVDFLNKHVPEFDKNTYFIGQSLGGLGITHWLSTKKGAKIGGALFVAAWRHIEKQTDSPNRYEFMLKFLEGNYHLLEPWINAPINTVDFIESTKGHLRVLVSDNDPCTIDTNQNKKSWEELGADVVVESGSAHFVVESHPKILQLALEMMK